MPNTTKVLINNEWVEVSKLGDNKSLPSAIVPNRTYAVHLDCGRKYFTVNWIKSLIEYMSSIGYTELHLHFSEEMAFRLESKLYPWLAGSDMSLCVRQLGQVDADEGKYLTQSEIVDICSFAKNYNVEIVPSFDTPGHINYILTKYEEHYGVEHSIRNYYHPRQTTINSLGSSYTKPISNNGLDLSNEVGVVFLKTLVKEIADLFFKCGCRKFDIGGDELLSYGKPLPSGNSRWRELTHWDEYAKIKYDSPLACAFDLYVGWMNELYYLLYSTGYTKIYMWNDVYGIIGSNYTNWKKVVTLNNNIILQWWTSTAGNSITLSDAIKSGFKIFNCSERFNYYVLTPNYTQPTINSFTEHDSTNFYYTTTDFRDSAVIGTMFCVWCDNPVGDNENNILKNIKPLLTAKIARKEI